MRKLVLHFYGVDSWNRPVFLDDKGRFFGDTGHCFRYDATKKEVLEWYMDMPFPLRMYFIYFGREFDCEPEGGAICDDVEVVLE